MHSAQYVTDTAAPSVILIPPTLLVPSAGKLGAFMDILCDTQSCCLQRHRILVVLKHAVW
jgi:hypothetical protein